MPGFYSSLRSLDTIPCTGCSRWTITARCTSCQGPTRSRKWMLPARRRRYWFFSSSNHLSDFFQISNIRIFTLLASSLPLRAVHHKLRHGQSAQSEQQRLKKKMSVRSQKVLPRNRPGPRRPPASAPLIDVTNSNHSLQDSKNLISTSNRRAHKIITIPSQIK